jgi:hypothetical protein
MSKRRHMLEGPHPLAGILIFLPADIQFAAIEWIREPKPAGPGRNVQRPKDSHQRPRKPSRKVSRERTTN